MIFALLIAAATSFKADFPQAKVKDDQDGAGIVSASGFAARGLANTPEAAARAFLKRYAADFGIGEDQKLVLQKGAAKSKLRFQRQIDSDPVFDADIEVTVNGANSVVQVRTEGVPRTVEGKFKLTKEQAIEAATNAQTDIARESHPQAVKGYRSVGATVKRVWRVDLIAGNPPGEWRSYIDAEDGALLTRVPVGVQPKPKKRDLAL